MVYVGVSEGGAYAVVYGNDAEVSIFDGENLIQFLKTLRGCYARCIVEMTTPGMETASMPMSASEAAYRFCRMKKLPCMVVKKGAWQREMGITGKTQEACKTIFPRVHIVVRSDGNSPEADALMLAEYARNSL